MPTEHGSQSKEAEHDDSRLIDRHIVVTGGAQGIGRGIAVRCAHAGANVSIFDTQPETAAETADLVRKEGSKAPIAEVDVSDAAAVKDAVDTAVAAQGPFHSCTGRT